MTSADRIDATGEEPLSRNATRYLSLAMHLDGERCRTNDLARAAVWDVMRALWERLDASERERLGAARDQAVAIAEGRS